MTKRVSIRVSGLGFLAILGALPLGGCAYDVEEGGGTVVTETREPLYVYATASLFTNNNWEVPVCWHPASTGSQDALEAAQIAFRNGVREQWEANTGLRFTGFEPCTTLASPWVPVHFRPSAGGSWGVASPGLGKRLEPNEWNFAADAQIGIEYDTPSVGVPYTAAHEMGHVIGAAHEHTRTDGDDTSDRCVIPRSNSRHWQLIPGQLQATVHDPLSVMHYCAGINNDGSSNILTGLDIIGGQMIYGLPPTATRELGFMRVVGSGGLQPAYSFNSTGAANSFTRNSTGSYTANFPRMGKVGGNVQVTPYNSLNRCSIIDWSSFGNVSVRVLCHNGAGARADAEFTVSFVGSSDGPGPVEGGYVWAYNPTGDLFPAQSYAWNSTGQPVNIDRTSTGVYEVFFVGQSFYGGTAEVSAYGGGTEYCKLDGLALVNNGNDKRVRVRCFSRTGTPADTFFSLRLNRASPMFTPTYSYALADQETNPQVYVPLSGTRLAYRPNLVGGTNGFAPTNVRRYRAGGYIVELPQMPYTADPLYLYKKFNVHVTAVGSGNAYCQLSTLTGIYNEQTTQANVICMNPAGTAFVDSEFIISYGSMQVDAPDSTIRATVERLPQNGSLGVGGLSRVDSNLYFTRSFDNVAGGQIMRYSTSTGALTSVVSGQSAIGLFADSSNLIWLGGNNTVKKSTLTGGSITTLASNQSFLYGNPTADASNVYYRQAVSQMGSGHKIMKLSRNGGTPVLLTTDEVSSDLVTDGVSVYWSARTATGHRIAKISVNGGAVTQLASDGGGALALSGTTLFFSNNANNYVYKIETSGGAWTQIVSGVPLTAPIAKLAVDGTDVYGSLAQPGNAIFKASSVYSPETFLARFRAFHEDSRSALALDPSNVYFVGATSTNGYLTLSRTSR